MPEILLPVCLIHGNTITPDSNICVSANCTNYSQQCSQINICISGTYIIIFLNILTEVTFI